MDAEHAAAKDGGANAGDVGRAPEDNATGPHPEASVPHAVPPTAEAGSPDVAPSTATGSAGGTAPAVPPAVPSAAVPQPQPGAASKALLSFGTLLASPVGTSAGLVPGSGTGGGFMGSWGGAGAVWGGAWAAAATRAFGIRCVGMASGPTAALWLQLGKSPCWPTPLANPRAVARTPYSAPR